MNAATACRKACWMPTNGIPSPPPRATRESKARIGVLQTQLSDADKRRGQQVGRRPSMPRR